MDMLTILGLILGAVAIFGGQFFEGGDVSSLLQPTAALIVFGGTIAAVFVEYSIYPVLRSIRLAFSTLSRGGENLQGTIFEIVDHATVTHKQGLLALDKRIPDIEDLFLKKGLQLVVDGVRVDEMKLTMGIDIESFEDREMEAARVFESAGGYAPTLGILGAVLGLIQVMENLADPSMIGDGIAVAFVATVYGVGIANLFWLPLSGKIKTRVREKIVHKELVVEGLASLAEGISPRLIEERLEGFLLLRERGREQI